MTKSSAPQCGMQHPDRKVPCEAPYGHRGQHRARRDNLRWGGKLTLTTPPKIKPLPAGKPLAPYRSPAEPGHAKFASIPGQMAMDLFSDDPDALVDPAS